jgi:hypothetical protein
MKGSVDRVDVDQVLPVLEASAISELDAAAEVVSAPSAPRSAPRPDARRTREFDDIPSVVRALLVGYDEV